MIPTTAQEKWNASFLSKNRRTIAALKKQLEQIPDNGQPPSRYMGIYVIFAKKCGCIVKSYAGGRVVTVGCKLHPTTMHFICPATNCGATFNAEKKFREHKWSHAY